MSILTLGLGAFVNPSLLVTLGLASSSTPPIPPAPANATPGFYFHSWASSIRKREDEEEKEERPQEPVAAPVAPAPAGDYSAYYRQSAKLAAAIKASKAEAAELRLSIAALQAKAQAAAEAERARAHYELLLAQQRMVLAQAQEAAYLEEMEAIDVAFIAAVVVVTLQ